MTARMVHPPILLGTAPMTNAQQMLLHPPACFGHPGPQIMAFGSRKAPVPKEGCRDTDVFRVSMGKGGSGAVAEEMRVDTPAKTGARPLNDPVIDRLLGHGRTVRGDPQRVSGRAGPTAREFEENRPPIGEPLFERRHEKLGPGELEGGACLGLVLREGDDPGAPDPLEMPSD